MKNFLTEEACIPTLKIREGLPAYFTNPFSYRPHPLCIEAASMVRQAISADPLLHGKLMEEGKMLGVLVAESPDGKIGFLAAHSGVLECHSLQGYFVPPVYDLLSPCSFFPEGEAEIIRINEKIDELQNDSEFCACISRRAEVKETHLAEIERLKEIYMKSKVEREKLRESIGKEIGLLQARLRTGLDGYEEELEIREALGDLDARLGEIPRESQFQKGEIRRAEKRMKEELALMEAWLQERYSRIEELKQLRKQKSIALQQKIFEHFSFLNARGERKNLLEIFGDIVPPAGTGECAGPRLLQYAYLHGYRPVAMGEFWYGGQISSELRMDGKFYPSCKGKCGPVLGFMLQGLEVDPENYHSGYGLVECALPVPEPEILYEDELIIAVNKPAGVLSVPGKNASEPHLAALIPGFQPDWKPVHRLDMHTSGVLLIAKDSATYRELQMQFSSAGVEKVYHAVLEGEVAPAAAGCVPALLAGELSHAAHAVDVAPAAADGCLSFLPGGEAASAAHYGCVVWNSAHSGEISIPLSPDYLNRPLQTADFEGGKPAITRFRILRREKGRSYIEFYPVTGRTHQLRVHSAHPQGLGTPIVGDLLYGKEASRLMLHAFSVKFIHPVKGEMVIVAPHPEGFIWIEGT